MRRFFYASAGLALVIVLSAVAYWWRDAHFAWSVIDKSLRVQEEWRPAGKVRWLIRLPDGTTRSGVAEVALRDSGLVMKTGAVEVFCSASGCQLRSPQYSLTSRPLESHQMKDFPGSARLLRSNYRVAHVGSRRAGGKICPVISVAPVNRGLYVRRLTVDPDTGFVIQSEVVGSGGEVLQRLEWLTVTFIARRQERRERLPQAGDRRLERILPPGFRLQKIGVSQCQCCSCGTVAHAAVASDGMVGLTLLQVQQEDSACPFCRAPKEGSGVVQAGSLSVAWSRMKRSTALWVVVGEVTPSLALRVAKSACATQPALSERQGGATVPIALPSSLPVGRR